MKIDDLPEVTHLTRDRAEVLTQATSYLKRNQGELNFSLLLALGKDRMKLFTSNYYRKIVHTHTNVHTHTALVVAGPSMYSSIIIPLYLIHLAVSLGFAFPLSSKLLSSYLLRVVSWDTSSTACVLLFNKYLLTAYPCIVSTPLSIRNEQ